MCVHELWPVITTPAVLEHSQGCTAEQQFVRPSVPEKYSQETELEDFQRSSEIYFEIEIAFAHHQQQQQHRKPKLPALKQRNLC